MSGERPAGGDVRLTVNGDEQLVPPDATVATLVAELGFEPRGIAVAVDGEVVTRRTWADRGCRPASRSRS